MIPKLCEKCIMLLFKKFIVIFDRWGVCVGGGGRGVG